MPVDSSGNIGSPVNVDADGGDKAVLQAIVTPDELHLYFTTYRLANYLLHIWESDRDSTSLPWGQPYLLPSPINEDAGANTDDTPLYITWDNCTLYYASHPGTPSLEMYKVTRGK